MVIDYREKGQLNVAELIELLQQQPPDALVWTDGGDGYGAANIVEYDDNDNSVLIGKCN